MKNLGQSNEAWFRKKFPCYRQYKVVVKTQMDRHLGESQIYPAKAMEVAVATPQTMAFDFTSSPVRPAKRANSRSHNLQMQGAHKLRSAAHLQVRRSDEVAAQSRRRWTFYETIYIPSSIMERSSSSNNRGFVGSLLFWINVFSRIVRASSFLIPRSEGFTGKSKPSHQVLDVGHKLLRGT